MNINGTHQAPQSAGTGFDAVAHHPRDDGDADDCQLGHRALPDAPDPFIYSLAGNDADAAGPHMGLIGKQAIPFAHVELSNRKNTINLNGRWKVNRYRSIQQAVQR